MDPELQPEKARDRNNAAELIHATVVWAAAGQAPCEVAVELPKGSTIGDAARKAFQSWLQETFEEMALGIFNRVQPADTLLRPGDRVEIYRPLVVDPKDARRVRAEIKQRRTARK